MMSMPIPRKRSLTISGHRTSISLEEPFWDALKDAADAQNVSLPALVAKIDGQRGAASLSGAIRVYLLQFYRDKVKALQGETDGSSPLNPPGSPDHGKP